MGNDNCVHAILVIEIIIKLLEISLSIAFFLDLLGLVVEVKRGGADL
jgi:hypothetical protein